MFCNTDQPMQVYLGFTFHYTPYICGWTATRPNDDIRISAWDETSLRDRIDQFVNAERAVDAMASIVALGEDRDADWDHYNEAIRTIEQFRGSSDNSDEPTQSEFLSERDAGALATWS